MVLSENLLIMLSAQYAHEMANIVFYDNLAAWADMRGLDGTASFLSKQADGERGHAKLVAAYIADRNAQMTPQPVNVDTRVPMGFEEVWMLAKEREGATSESIRLIKVQAEGEGDMATCAWLMQPSGLIMEQIEEERTVQTILDRIATRGTDTASIHDIDAWIKATFA